MNSFVSNCKKASVILVGPGLKESNENQGVLQIIF